jgi:hypothetical protein
MKDLGKILTRISDNLGKILPSMARLNNLCKILVISWQDLAKISVLPRLCHDLPRSCKILQDLAKIFNLGCVAFLERETTRYEMSHYDFEFLCGDALRKGEDAEKLLIQ